MVQALVGEVGTAAPQDLQTAVKAIMLEWSGSTGIDPASRGDSFDAQQLDFLEKYTGVAFNNATYSTDAVGEPTDPRWRAAIDLHEAWNSAFDSTEARVLGLTQHRCYQPQSSAGHPRSDARKGELW